MFSRKIMKVTRQARTGNVMSSFYHIIYLWLMAVVQPLSFFFPTGLDIDEKRKRAMVVLGALAGIPILIFFIQQDFFFSDLSGAAVDASLAFLFLIFLLFSRYVKNGIWFYRILSVGLMVVLTYNFYFGPAGDSSLMWMFVFPMVVFFVLGIPEGLLWYLVLTTINISSLFFPQMTGAHIYSDDMRARFLSAYIIITVLALCFEFLRWYFYTQLERERQKLKQTMEQVRTLDGLVPICSMCKKIRDDKGYWNQLEQYLLDHTDAKLTHGICDDCYAKHYPKEFARRKTKTIRVVQLPETDET
jgi:hypothetical protein